MPTLAFLGATGGCVNQTLIRALQSTSPVYTCRALVRTPKKLLDALKAEGVSDAALQRLTIVTGNAKDINAVRALLDTSNTIKSGTQDAAANGKPTMRSDSAVNTSNSRKSSSSSNGRPGTRNNSHANNTETITPSPAEEISTIVFGIGSVPKLQFSLLHPVTLIDPEICATSMAVLLQAMSYLPHSSLPPSPTSSTPAGSHSPSPTRMPSKPNVVAISTTGVTSGPRDVPLLYVPLYHWLLSVPHADKRKMEALLWADAKKARNERATGGFVIVRPTLLMGGAKGRRHVKWGSEGQPALGWTIGKKDVGDWVFEMIVQESGGEQGPEQERKMGNLGRDVAVSLTT